jgi:hypothetical protein
MKLNLHSQTRQYQRRCGVRLCEVKEAMDSDPLMSTNSWSLTLWCKQMGRVWHCDIDELVESGSLSDMPMTRLSLTLQYQSCCEVRSVVKFDCVMYMTWRSLIWHCRWCGRIGSAMSLPQWSLTQQCQQCGGMWPCDVAVSICSRCQWHDGVWYW